MGKTTHLRRELKARFYPFFAARGFVLDTTHAPFSVDFRRITAGGVDVFDLQWDKSGQPRFVVNFGHCPADGVVHHGEQVAPDKVLAYMFLVRPPTTGEGRRNAVLVQSGPFVLPSRGAASATLAGR